MKLSLEMFVRRAVNRLKLAPTKLFSITGGAEPLGGYLGSMDVEEIKKVEQKDEELRRKCDAMNDKWSLEEAIDARRKRITYRSKQRGFLEADLLLGSWAKLNVPRMSQNELDEMEILLKEETLPLFNFICGKEPLPNHLQQLSVMKPLMEYANSSKIDSPDSYAAIKRKANLT